MFEVVDSHTLNYVIHNCRLGVRYKFKVMNRVITGNVDKVVVVMGSGPRINLSVWCKTTVRRNQRKFDLVKESKRDKKYCYSIKHLSQEVNPKRS